MAWDAIPATAHHTSRLDRLLHPRANGGLAHQVREGHGPEDVGARGLMQADCEESGQVAFDGEL